MKKKKQTPKEIEGAIIAKKKTPAAAKNDFAAMIEKVKKEMKNGAWVDEFSKVVAEKIKKDESILPTVRPTPSVAGGKGVVENPYWGLARMEREESEWWQMESMRQMETMVWGGRGAGKTMSMPERMDYNVGQPPPQYGMSRQYQSNIVCPVCGSNQCGWWYERIQEDRAGDVLKDMMNGIFKGDSAYMGGDQERYYQQRREQFYGRGRSGPANGGRYNYDSSTGQFTEDIDFEIVETEKKLKALQEKRRALPPPQPPREPIKF